MKKCGGRGKKKGATLYCLPCHGKGFVEESRYFSLAAKKGRKSFFKGFLGTFKIL